VSQFRMPTTYPIRGPDGQPGGPYYWMWEATGVLRGAVTAYLDHGESPEQLRLVIDYCRYWVKAPAWQGLSPELVARGDHITTREGLQAWIWEMVAAGIDPL
jgi:hypothetical protein